MDKALYLSTYLDNGSPRSWFTAIHYTNDDLLHNFDSLIEDFRQHFGDPDTKGTTLCKIENLWQTGSCMNYVSKFHKLLVYVNFNTSTTIQKYYKGLKDEVKDLLLTVHSPPMDFDNYVDLIVTIDNWLHYWEVECKTAKKPASCSKPVLTTPSPTPSPNHPPQCHSPQKFQWRLMPLGWCHASLSPRRSKTVTLLRASAYIAEVLSTPSRPA
jgi:hypothetical protein